MANNDDSGTFMAGFLFGGIIGAIVGILLAPKAGSETRAELAGQSEVWRDRAEEIAARVRERVGPAVEGVRERVAPGGLDIMREPVAPLADDINSRVAGGIVEPAVDGGPTVDGEVADDIDVDESETPTPEKLA
jgi:gas vesicle protein